MKNNEEREEDRPLFEVHEVGPVKFYEAAEGVDWLSLFPNDPKGSDPEKQLIDLPLAVEPPTPPASAANPRPVDSSSDVPPRQYIEVLYPPGPKRMPRFAIALSIAGVLAVAFFLYWLVTPPAAQPSTALAQSAAQAPAEVPDRLTMEALAPPASPSPTPSPAAPAPVLSPKPTPTVTPKPARTAAPRSTPTPAARTTQLPVRMPPVILNRSASLPSPPPPSLPSPSPSPAPAVPASAPSTVALPPPSASTPTPMPANSPVATPRPTPSPSPSPVNTAAAETAAVRAVLDNYRAAFESLSSESVRSVWPGVNAAALSRAFKQMESQSMDFYSCGIELGTATAEATCAGAITFVPKVGGKTPRVETHGWTFFLSRKNDRWIIDRVVSR